MSYLQYLTRHGGEINWFEIYGMYEQLLRAYNLLKPQTKEGGSNSARRDPSNHTIGHRQPTTKSGHIQHANSIRTVIMSVSERAFTSR